jgi:hypothetical protein
MRHKSLNLLLDSGNPALQAGLNNSGGGRDSIHMNKLINRFEDLNEKQDSDSEEDERDKKFAPPPAYFKKFFFSPDAMAPPDLESLLKKDYSILY